MAWLFPCYGGMIFGFRGSGSGSGRFLGDVVMSLLEYCVSQVANPFVCQVFHFAASILYIESTSEYKMLSFLGLRPSFK